MITDISTSIMTLFNSTPGGTALRTVLSGGLYFSEAGPGVSFPYGVFQWNGSNVDEIAGGATNRIETASITVRLFSKNDDGGTEVFDIASKFMALYDWATLAFPDGSTYSPLAFQRISIVNRGKSDNIWLIEIDYDLMFEH